MAESEEEKLQEERWARVRARLRAVVGANAFKLWLERLQFEFIHNNIFVCSLPTQSLTHWARNHYEEELLSAAKAEYTEVPLERAAFLHRKLGQPIVPPKEKAVEKEEDPDPIIGTPYRAPEQGAKARVPQDGIDSLVVTQAEIASRMNATEAEQEQVQGSNSKLSMKAVAETLCEYFRLSYDEMITSRLREQVLKRDITIFLVRSLTVATLEQIGRFFGGRSPAGIRKSLSKIESLKLDDSTVAARVKQAEAYLNHRLQSPA